MTALRRIARALAIPVVLLLAVTLQLALVNRAPLPGGATPDLVLLAVAAIAVCTGPMTGMLAGFCGGLALDIAPPAAHLAGEYALVFCLVGYACGRARNAITYATGEQTMITSLTVMALGVAAGEAGKAALGMMLSDPDVTSPAIKHVLPVAIVYDLLLCPFAYWLISLMLRRPAPERAPRPEFAQVATAFRAASAGALGAVPALRLARQHPAPGPSPGPPGAKAAALSRPPFLAIRNVRRILPGETATRQRPGREAELRRAQGWHRRPPAAAAHVAGQGVAARAASRRSAGPEAQAAAEGLAARGRPAGTAPLRRRSPGRGWLRGAGPAGTPAMRSGSPPKGWLHAGRSGAPRAPRRPAGTPALSRKSPARGWLRPAKPVPPARRRTPGRGWLRPARPAKLSWYAKSPGSQWVRRSHSPWRSRRRRLLALVGVRR